MEYDQIESAVTKVLQNYSHLLYCGNYGPAGKKWLEFESEKTNDSVLFLYNGEEIYGPWTCDNFRPVK